MGLHSSCCTPYSVQAGHGGDFDGLSRWNANPILYEAREGGQPALSRMKVQGLQCFEEPSVPNGIGRRRQQKRKGNDHHHHQIEVVNSGAGQDKLKHETKTETGTGP